MSVVVAIKDDENILVGCDSQTTYGNTKITKKSHFKIWKPKDDNEIVMGLVGYTRDNNILSTSTEWIDELTKLKNEVDFKYIVRNITPKIFKELNNYGRMKSSNGIQSIQSDIMFAYKDNAFTIDSDGCVTEIHDILTLGSGNRLCIGAWNSLKDKDIPIKDKLVSTIKAACDSDLYVNYPIVIMNTKDDTIDIIEK
jgi:ATP-dependent protease HslVU (ClpYQ) peptidase subunit